MICGIDLAAREKNITGMAFIDSSRIFAFSVHTDDEIISAIEERDVEIIAIDAPFTLEERYAERYLRKYGALSLKIPAMRELAMRAIKLRDKLSGYRVIEVFPTATAKILGFYSKDKRKILEHFSQYDIKGGRNRHEVDAILAAYTAYLYVNGKTIEVDGVVIPANPGIQ